MKIILLFTFSLIILSSSLHASIYKGQRYYQKKCTICHGKALEFVNDKTSSRWKSYLADKGNILYFLHKNSEDATSSMEYFDSTKYRKNLKHLRDFFLEYASDTGNIPVSE